MILFGKFLLIFYAVCLTRVESEDLNPLTNWTTTMATKEIRPTLSNLDEIEAAFPGFLSPDNELALLLDYDGTLAPIVANPNHTEMPPELEKALRSLAKHPKVFVAIISGRSLQDVKNTAGIPGIAYAGNHGIEIEFADGLRYDYELPEKVQNDHKALVAEFHAKLYKYNAWIEDKKLSLTYHYREVPREHVEEIKSQAIEIIQKHGFLANSAHEAIEAKPPVNWNKGEAALYILKKRFGEDFSKKAKIIFAGDDTTDEDAMRALQGIGKSFRVTENPTVKTYADYRLPSQAVVTDLLKWIASTYTV